MCSNKLSVMIRDVSCARALFPQLTSFLSRCWCNWIISVTLPLSLTDGTVNILLLNVHCFVEVTIIWSSSYIMVGASSFILQ